MGSDGTGCKDWVRMRLEAGGGGGEVDWVRGRGCGDGDTVMAALPTSLRLLQNSFSDLLVQLRRGWGWAVSAGTRGHACRSEETYILRVPSAPARYPSHCLGRVATARVFAMGSTRYYWLYVPRGGRRSIGRVENVDIRVDVA